MSVLTAHTALEILLRLTWQGPGDVDILNTAWELVEFPIRMGGRLMILGNSPLWKYLLPSCRVAYQFSMHSSQNRYWHTASFPVRAGTSSRDCGGANKIPRPQGQELSKAMIAIDAAGTTGNVEDGSRTRKICPKVQYL